MLNTSHVLFSSAAHEQHFVGLLEIGSVLQFLYIERTAAEHAHVGECLGVGQSNHVGLHSSHRQTCHGTMVSIGYHAVVLLHHGDDILKEHFLESVETSKATAWTTGSATLGTAGTTTGAHALWTSAALTLWTWAHAGESSETLCLCGVGMCGYGVESVVHHNDEWHGFALGDKIVHDDASLALCRPACLVFTHAMLQVEHGEFLRGVLTVSSGQIDVAVAHLLCHCRVIVYLAHRTLGYVLYGVEVLIGCWHIDAASPSAGTIVVSAAGVGDGSTVDVELVIVESFVLWGRLTGPYTLGIFHQVVFHTSDIEFHAFGIGSGNSSAYHTL